MCITERLRDIYIYIHTYIYGYTYTYTHMNMYIYIYVHAYIESIKLCRRLIGRLRGLSVFWTHIYDHTSRLRSCPLVTSRTAADAAPLSPEPRGLHFCQDVSDQQAGRLGVSLKDAELWFKLGVAGLVMSSSPKSRILESRNAAAACCCRGG